MIQQTLLCLFFPLLFLLFGKIEVFLIGIGKEVVILFGLLVDVLVNILNKLVIFLYEILYKILYSRGILAYGYGEFLAYLRISGDRECRAVGFNGIAVAGIELMF